MRRIVQSKRLALFLATVGFMLYGFCGMFGRLRGVFNDPKEDMSFGWLVPLFALYVLWTERRELREAVGKPSFAGLLACLPCMAVALLGSRGLQVRLEQMGFIGLCVALPWAFFGWRLARLCVFPAFFLLFTVPVSSFLDVITIHLRLLATGTAFAVLKGFGIDAVQQGTAIYAQGAHPFSIDVAEPCSGLRSLVALMALTAAYAWHSQPTWPRRAALFACSVPLAILGNVVRILSISLCAAWGSPEFATGFYHDYSGYVIFIVAIACMVACGEVIGRMSQGRPAVVRSRKGAEPARAFQNLKCVKELDGAAKGMPAQGSGRAVVGGPLDDVEVCAEGSGGRTWLACVAAAVLAPIFLFQAWTPVSMIMSPPEVELPAKLPGYQTDRLLYCHNEQCACTVLASRLEKADAGCPVCGGELHGVSLGEKTVLPEDTRITKRIYRTPYGVQFLVSVVVGGKSKQSIHRPELCMPAQGFVMSNPRSFKVADRPYNAIHIQGRGRPQSVLAYTFFNQEGVRTASHMRRIFVDTWDRTVHNRVDRWVMVTVNASVPFDGEGFGLMHEADRLTLEDFLARLQEKLP